MKKHILALLSIGAALIPLQGQEQLFVARHAENESGPFNAGRVRSNATFDGTQLGQWENRGNAGIVGDGTIWHGFTRYKMNERDLLNAITEAGEITWTTGLLQKEKNRAIDPINGGHDVDVYLILDPAGTVVPSGQTPSINDAWDWANEFGMGYANSVYLGRVLQSEPSSTEEERNSEGIIEVDSPAMRIVFDLTQPLKTWINDGLLTADSTIAIGLVQRAAQISENGAPKFDDPNLYIHSQMVFEVKNAFIKTAAGSAPEMGPGVFAEYEMVDGYIDTGDWLGMVYAADYPWTYVFDLGKHVYFTGNDGWTYVPN